VPQAHRTIWGRCTMRQGLGGAGCRRRISAGVGSYPITPGHLSGGSQAGTGQGLLQVTGRGRLCPSQLMPAHQPQLRNER
jgi:hypothetical protein